MRKNQTTVQGPETTTFSEFQKLTNRAAASIGETDETNVPAQDTPPGVELIYQACPDGNDDVRGIGFREGKLVQFTGSRVKLITLAGSVRLARRLEEQCNACQDGPCFEDRGRDAFTKWMRQIEAALR